MKQKPSIRAVRIPIMVASLVLLGILSQWQDRNDSTADNEFPHQTPSVQNDSAPLQSNPSEAIEAITSTDSKPTTVPEPNSMEQLAQSQEQTLEQLNTLLPEWLAKDGNLFSDERQINGHTVLRTRGRYTWENGELLEIEITDLGAHADESLVKSLGFNTSLQSQESPAGFTQTQDEDNYYINQEYHFEDQAGSLQVLMEGRYLIEVQIEQLPEATFQQILDADIPFDKLFIQMED